MKKKIVIVSMAGLLFGVTSCGLKNESKDNENQMDTLTIPMADNSMTSLNWDGVYEGVIPCADCSGIQVRLELTTDLTYKLMYDYQGKEPKNVSNLSGTFYWDKTGSFITLDGIKEGSYPVHYQVGENIIRQLDMDGNVIIDNWENAYILQKTS
ncbi:MAG: copper resistance protein NlpE [Bacteroidales bacterium]|jgi:uncharacterized lipoprotein NlpE involved in copper resistance|nr:copper resistance protein NlpE [Bacteroidales bacterium]